jgi:hypothetical protein
MESKTFEGMFLEKYKELCLKYKVPEFISIQDPSVNGYPIIIDISSNKKDFKVDKNDPAFSKPYDKLTKTY